MPPGDTQFFAHRSWATREIAGRRPDAPGPFPLLVACCTQEENELPLSQTRGRNETGDGDERDGVRGARSGPRTGSNGGSLGPVGTTSTDDHRRTRRHERARCSRCGDERAGVEIALSVRARGSRTDRAAGAATRPLESVDVQWPPSSQATTRRSSASAPQHAGAAQRKVADSAPV